MGPDCDLSLFHFEDLITSVAILKSEIISNKLFFFWPEMKRVGMKIYCNDNIFNYENFVNQNNNRRIKGKGKRLL